MVVDHQIDVRPNRVTHHRDVILELPGFGPLIEVDHRVSPAALDRSEALLDTCLCNFGRVCPRVGTDTVPDRAAQQLIHGNVKRLALDVPQRLVDGAKRRADDYAVPVPVVEVHELPGALDVERAPADDLWSEHMHRLGDRRCLVDQAALSPTVDALVGLDFDEHPVAPRAFGPHDERLDVGDVHSSILPYTLTPVSSTGQAPTLSLRRWGQSIEVQALKVVSTYPLSALRESGQLF